MKFLFEAMTLTNFYRIYQDGGKYYAENLKGGGFYFTIEDDDGEAGELAQILWRRLSSLLKLPEKSQGNL